MWKKKQDDKSDNQNKRLLVGIVVFIAIATLIGLYVFFAYRGQNSDDQIDENDNREETNSEVNILVILLPIGLVLFFAVSILGVTSWKSNPSRKNKIKAKSKENDVLRKTAINNSDIKSIIKIANEEGLKSEMKNLKSDPDWKNLDKVTQQKEVQKLKTAHAMKIIQKRMWKNKGLSKKLSVSSNVNQTYVNFVEGLLSKLRSQPSDNTALEVLSALELYNHFEKNLKFVALNDAILDGQVDDANTILSEMKITQKSYNKIRSKVFQVLQNTLGYKKKEVIERVLKGNGSEPNGFTSNAKSTDPFLVYDYHPEYGKKPTKFTPKVAALLANEKHRSAVSATGTHFREIINWGQALVRSIRRDEKRDVEDIQGYDPEYDNSGHLMDMPRNLAKSKHAMLLMLNLEVWKDTLHLAEQAKRIKKAHGKNGRFPLQYSYVELFDKKNRAIAKQIAGFLLKEYEEANGSKKEEFDFVTEKMLTDMREIAR